MIVLDLNGQMQCVENNCTEVLPVGFCLLGSGGFGFKPAPGTKWQVLHTPGNPLGPMMARCPAHTVKLQTGPAGPRIVMANGR